MKAIWSRLQPMDAIAHFQLWKKNVKTTSVPNVSHFEPMCRNLAVCTTTMIINVRNNGNRKSYIIHQQTALKKKLFPFFLLLIHTKEGRTNFVELNLLYTQYKLYEYEYKVGKYRKSKGTKLWIVKKSENGNSLKVFLESSAKVQNEKWKKRTKYEVN